MKTANMFVRKKLQQTYIVTADIWHHEMGSASANQEAASGLTDQSGLR